MIEKKLIKWVVHKRRTNENEKAKHALISCSMVYLLNKILVKVQDICQQYCISI